MKDDFTLEDILEEQRLEREKAQAAGRERSLPEGVEYVEVEPDLEEASFSYPQAAATGTREEQPAPVYEEPSVPSPPIQDQTPPQREDEPAPEEPEGKKKKKKRWGLFGRKKKVPDFDENEDDMYYGIQLKPIDEYRLDGDTPPLGEEGYKALFDDSQAIDDEVEENFQRLQKERRRRVAEAVQSAGMDEQQVADEFGVVAPMPVTPFAADPYARQHGLDPEGAQTQAGLSDLQKAMLETSDQTMEIKLNVLNSTMELQSLRDAQPVSDETVDRILASAPAEPPVYQEQPQVQREEPYVPEEIYQELLPEKPAQSEYGEYPEPIYEEDAQASYAEPQAYAPAPLEEYPEYGEYREEPGYPAEGQSLPAYPQEGPQYERQEPELPMGSGTIPVYQEASSSESPPVQAAGPGREYPRVQEYQEQPTVRPSQEPVPARTIEMPKSAIEKELEAAQASKGPTAEPPKPAPPPRPVHEVPYVEDIFQYRSRNISTHIINADVLQSALLSESESLQRHRDAMQAKQAPRKRVKRPRPEEAAETAAQEQSPRKGAEESIEDYTGPEDARSISNELRGEMRELSLRLMITGVCTVLLALVSLICRSRFSLKESGGSWPLAYVILTLVFLIVAAGVCYKTVGNGLKALFSAKANSDSGVAVAVLAVLVQTVTSLFFRDQLVEAGLHLYAAVASALLFVNAAGKLTMIRRIHSNFRFVTSREQKYGVQLYDDYNTSLKMTKDCVAEKPLVAYQCRAGFLKRFLELSYTPDPSEASSQLMAPLGLISSLVLCIATLLITRNVPTAIGAFSAACCACVAAGNMLSVNLPISNMCKTVRRAGGMAVGYEAVDKLGDVNAVIADAGELFPTGTVVLAGIKTFGSKVMAEDGIMAASALMKEVGGPLSGVFDQVISENEDALPQVEKYAYEAGGGVVGRVDGQTIYIGVRGLLINHRLEAPSREEETQYASGNKNIIYIAVDADVVAMLVLTYAADRRRKNELQRLEDSGISVLVRTTDPNVTVGLVSRLFGIDSASVGILDGQLGEIARQLTQETAPRADAVAATKGRMESMMSLIAACVEQKRMAGVLVAIQTAALILGFVLVAFLSCFGFIRQLSAFLLFGFEMFWVAVLVLLPKLRR